MARLVNRLRAVHPGAVLREVYLAAFGLGVNALSLAPARTRSSRCKFAREQTTAREGKSDS